MDWKQLQTRYLQDDWHRQLGNLASSLGRVGARAQSSENDSAVADLLREAALFIEWSAPQAPQDVVCELAPLQRELVLWRNIWPADATRRLLAFRARAMSDHILELSGLLEIEYPESDGQPMVETDTHYRELTGLRFALETHFRDDANVYIGANMMLYYVEGDPSQVAAPDVFVVFGVPKGERRTFKTWIEGKVPDVVFELTSRSTRQDDLRDKRVLYEGLGVSEYFLFDPLDEYLEPPLMGFRLQAGYYAPLTPERKPGGELRLASDVLDLELHVQAGHLRLSDPKTGRLLLTPDEAWDRAQRAEAEVTRLRAELARLQAPR
jgi:Uma2 family endonuclease